jgi:hypothetical protein
MTMISENLFLVLSKKVQNLGFRQSLTEISKITFDEMPIDRLSVWTFEKNPAILRCNFKMQGDETSFDCDTTLDLKKYPAYHNSLLEEKVIVANDVYNSKYEFELDEVYLKPNNICSSMSIPFFVDGHLAGMVVVSTIGHYYNWTRDNIQFGNDVALVISIAYISSKRNEDLQKLNKYAEKIKTHNKELQAIIKLKNEQFIEYGFINSHLLNAPLSRLKGLMNILVLELNGERREADIQFITQKIYEAYDEMDKVVKQISVLVDKGVDIDRDDIVLD